MRRLALGLALVALGGAGAAERMRGASEGIYTEAQATRGAARYAQQCARCHGQQLLGTYDIPSLRGSMVAHWSSVPLGGLFDYISKAMPIQSPGALPPATNADILAYILKANGYRAGTAELPPDGKALASIRLDPAL